MTSISEARSWPTVKIFHVENAPKKIFDWRHKTFVEERSFLMTDQLTCENDQEGCHILLESDDGSRVIGATHVMFAEESDFSRHTGIAPKHLIDGVYSSRSFVTPDARHRGYFSLLIYLAMRWARMHGRTSYFGCIPHIDGGQNGHWQAIRPLISRYIEGEFAMQRALSIAKALLASQRQAYDSIAKMLDPLSSAISGINYQTATSSVRKTKDLSKSA